MCACTTVPTGTEFIAEAIAHGMSLSDAIALDMALTAAEEQITTAPTVAAAEAAAETWEDEIVTLFGPHFPDVAV
jgi:IMP cyclohydrolase